MGKQASTIGIPIKLLNEAQVRRFYIFSAKFGGFSLLVDWDQRLCMNSKLTSFGVRRDMLLRWRSRPARCIEESCLKVRRMRPFYSVGIPVLDDSLNSFFPRPSSRLASTPSTVLIENDLASKVC